MALIKCGNCEKDVSNKAQFCVYCGYSLDTIKCEDCGQALPANAQFCMNCGCPVESKEVPVKSTDKTDGTGYTVLYSQEETQQRSVDTPTQTVKSKKSAHNKMEIICAVIAIVALAIFVPIAIVSFGNDDGGHSVIQKNKSGERIAITYENYDEYLDFDVYHTISPIQGEPGYYTLSFNASTKGKPGYIYENVFIKISLTFDYDTVFDNHTSATVESEYFQIDSDGNGNVKATKICVHQHPKNFESRGYKIESITGYVVVE